MSRFLDYLAMTILSLLTAGAICGVAYAVFTLSGGEAAVLAVLLVVAWAVIRVDRI